MWATGTTPMIARVAGSTLFANQNLISTLTIDHRSMSTGTNKTSFSADDVGVNTNLINRMRDLRARSPYATFVKDNYRDMSAKYPDFKLADVSKKLAEAWKSLSDEKKQTYVKRTQDQKVVYENEKQRLSPSELQTIDADEKARRIQQRIRKTIQDLPTKRPRTAFVHFLLSLDRGEANMKDFMKGAAQRWSQMTVQDKQKYEDLYQEEKQAYSKALVAWDAAQTKTPKAASPRSSSSASPRSASSSASPRSASSSASPRSSSSPASKKKKKKVRSAVSKH